MTAALQLFAHLDGEAINVALLMPVKQRERWKDLADGLSEYYNSPGRLAVVRRRFESARRRSGMDLATFARELGILAMRGFADMGERTRDLMIRNKFIAAQQSCELRVRESRCTPNAQGFPALGSHSPASDGRREHPVPDDSGDVLAEDTSKVPTSPLEMGRGQMVPRGHRASVPYRGMRPAGVAGPALQETPVGVLDVRKKAAARPLSAGAATFSSTL